MEYKGPHSCPLKACRIDKRRHGTAAVKMIYIAPMAYRLLSNLKNVDRVSRLGSGSGVVMY